MLAHAKELETIQYVVEQITTGDYAVVSNAGVVLAVIERKSLEDYAASLKDGRADNKRKMIALRAETGCRIYYIIEGPPFPKPSDCFGNIPYKHIQSSIFHLSARDNICIINTRDTLHTAQTLAAFVHSMDKIDEPLEQIEEVVAPAMDLQSIISRMTKKQEKTKHEMVREIWASFPGIAVESADEFISAWSISDIITGKVTPAIITGHKLASGRKIGKKAVESLLNVNKLLQVRLLSRVPGVSHAAAVAILNKHTLRDILSWGVDGIAMIIISGKRRVGEHLAALIVDLFTYRYVKPAVCSAGSMPNQPMISQPIPIVISQADADDVLNYLSLC